MFGKKSNKGFVSDVFVMQHRGTLQLWAFLDTDEKFGKQ